MSAPAFSVVIPTHQRRDSLVRVLNGLAAQTMPPDEFEVVVISDGSTDGTVEATRALRVPYRLDVLSQPNSGPAAARNLGLSRARGRHILFLDDDVLPAPELLAEHAKAHEGRDDLVVIGPLLPAPDPSSIWVAWETDVLEKQYLNVESGVWETTARQFFTGNASVLKRHLDDAGGFDPAFLRTEDVELGFRLSSAGLRFEFRRAAAATHIANRPFASWLRTATQYGRNDIVIGARRNRRDLLQSIAREFQDRHPMTRVAVRLALRMPPLRPVLPFVARTLINGVDRLGRRRQALAGCSALFNVFYWYGVADELGGARPARLLLQSDPWVAPLIVGHALARCGRTPTVSANASASVILCTRDRMPSLGAAISSVVAALTPSAELIVVDQGSGQGTRDLVRGIEDRGRIRYVRSDRLGLAAARNEGAAHARGQLLLFTDDDCVVDQHWVGAWQELFAAHPDAGIGFGEVTAPDYDRRSGFVPVFDADEASHGRRLFWTGIGSIGMGANMAMPRSVWQAVGGFDEALGAGQRLAAAEDSDMAFRIAATGARILHSRRPTVRHDGFRLAAEAAALVPGYFGGVGAMYLKHARCGDVAAALLFAREGGNLAQGAARRALARRRPLGLRSLAAYIGVAGASLRLRVESDRRVFATARPAP